MKKFSWTIFAVLFVGLWPIAAYGDLITIGIEATVTYISGSDLLEGKVAVGSIITGTYTYDTATSDTNPSPNSGEYVHHTSPCGIVLNLGDFIFSTDFNNVDFVVGITNVSSGFSDVYSIGSRNNLSLYNGVEVDALFWQLEDNTGTALSDTTLPTIAPILSNWQYDNNLVMGGGIGGTPPCYDKTFAIAANVTSAVLIPEPMSLLLFSFGLLVLRKLK